MNDSFGKTIEQYEYILLTSRIRYSLYSDRVHVSGKYLTAGTYDIDYRLKELNSTFQTGVTRNSKATAMMGALTIAGTWPVAYLFRNVSHNFPGTFVSLFIGGLILACILMVLSPFRNKYVTYRYTSGLVAFSVFRGGRRASDFDRFVQQLNQAVLAVHSKEKEVT